MIKTHSFLFFAVRCTYSKCTLLSIQFSSLAKVYTEVVFALYASETGCTIVLSHQQYMAVPVTPHSHKHLVLHLFNFSHPSLCEVVSQCSFNLHFPDDN